MSKLTVYIEKELNKGFSSEKIRETLLKYNYPAAEVDAAVLEVKEHEFPQHRWKKPVFWEILAVVVAVIVIVYLLIAPQQATQPIPEKKQQLVVPECDGLLPAERDGCILQLAKQKDDTALCTLVTDLGKNIACFQRIWKKDYCRYLDIVHQNADQCYINRATAQKNLNFCIFTVNVSDCTLQVLQSLEINDRCLQSNCSGIVDALALIPMVQHLQQETCQSLFCLYKKLPADKFREYVTATAKTGVDTDEELFDIALKEKEINICAVIIKIQLQQKCRQKLQGGTT